MYEDVVDRAGTADFQQYEIANFARDQSDTSGQGPNASGRVEMEDAGIPAFACRHNVNYWRGGSYHGLGPSAAEYMQGVRTKNWSNTVLYCDCLEQGRRAVEWREALPPLARAGETAAFGLRMNAGWPFDWFQRVTGFDLRHEWSSEIEHLVAAGFARATDERFHLTARGLRFADWVAEQFLRPQVSVAR